jgi:hypothetical protein
MLANHLGITSEMAMKMAGEDLTGLPQGYPSVFEAWQNEWMYSDSQNDVTTIADPTATSLLSMDQPLPITPKPPIHSPEWGYKKLVSHMALLSLSAFPGMTNDTAHFLAELDVLNLPAGYDSALGTWVEEEMGLSRAPLHLVDDSNVDSDSSESPPEEIFMFDETEIVANLDPDSHPPSLHADNPRMLSYLAGLMLATFGNSMTPVTALKLASTDLVALPSGLPSALDAWITDTLGITVSPSTQSLFSIDRALAESENYSVSQPSPPDTNHRLHQRVAWLIECAYPHYDRDEADRIATLDLVAVPQGWPSLLAPPLTKEEHTQPPISTAMPAATMDPADMFVFEERQDAPLATPADNDSTPTGSPTGNPGPIRRQPPMRAALQRSQSGVTHVFTSGRPGRYTVVTSDN